MKKNKTEWVTVDNPILGTKYRIRKMTSKKKQSKWEENYIIDEDKDAFGRWVRMYFEHIEEKIEEEKQKSWDKAIEECISALQLQPSYVVALQRPVSTKMAKQVEWIEQTCKMLKKLKQGGDE